MAQIKIKKELCPQNHPCPVARRCPVGAIKQDNPYSAPRIIEAQCKHCGICNKLLSRIPRSCCLNHPTKSKFSNKELKTKKKEKENERT